MTSDEKLEMLVTLLDASDNESTKLEAYGQKELARASIF